MTDEVDFSKAKRGVHHVPKQAAVLLPVGIERSVWEYFSQKAESEGVGLSELVTDVLRRNIVANEE